MKRTSDTLVLKDGKHKRYLKVASLGDQDWTCCEVDESGSSKSYDHHFFFSRSAVFHEWGFDSNGLPSSFSYRNNRPFSDSSEAVLAFAVAELNRQCKASGVLPDVMEEVDIHVANYFIPSLMTLEERNTKKEEALRDEIKTLKLKLDEATRTKVHDSMLLKY